MFIAPRAHYSCPASETFNYVITIPHRPDWWEWLWLNSGPLAIMSLSIFGFTIGLAAYHMSRRSEAGLLELYDDPDYRRALKDRGQQARWDKPTRAKR